MSLIAPNQLTDHSGKANEGNSGPEAPIFANYQPQAVYTVPAGHHTTCTAAVCIERRRWAGPGSLYVVQDRTIGNPKGRAEHLSCNTHAFEALFQQERIDSTVELADDKGGSF